jgi:hypothetical protein
MNYEDTKKEMLTAHYEIINTIRSSFQKVEEELTKQNIKYVNTIRNSFFGLKLTEISFYIGAKPDTLNEFVTLNIDGVEETFKVKKIIGKGVKGDKYGYSCEFIPFYDGEGLTELILKHIISKEIPEIEW